jgi:hypothetical protein
MQLLAWNDENETTCDMVRNFVPSVTLQPRFRLPQRPNCIQRIIMTVISNFRLSSPMSTHHASHFYKPLREQNLILVSVASKCHRCTGMIDSTYVEFRGPAGWCQVLAPASYEKKVRFFFFFGHCPQPP